MKNRYWIIMAAMCMILSVGATALSQRGSAKRRVQPTATKTQDKRTQIRHLLNLMGTGKTGTQIMDQMFDTMRKNIREVPAHVWDELLAEFKNEFSAETIIELNIPIYDKYYSSEEIQQLIAFYESPIGRKATAVLPMIVRDSYAVGIQKAHEVLQKIQERLKSKGYEVSIS